MRPPHSVRDLPVGVRSAIAQAAQISEQLAVCSSAHRRAVLRYPARRLGERSVRTIGTRPLGVERRWAAGARNPVDGGGASQVCLALRLLIELSGHAPYAQSPATTRVGKSTSEGVNVNGVDQATPQCATTEYPPADWVANREFKAPGPVSRQLANYFAMCAPRSRRGARRARFASSGPAAAD